MLFYFSQYLKSNLKVLYYRLILQECGTNFKAWGIFDIKNPQKICIGDNFSINDRAYINGMGGIQIGHNVAISAHAIIVSTTLDHKKLSVKSHINKIIKIGNNVQIGVGAIILPGVTIGDNVLIAAGSVVTKDVMNDCIVAGNPARKIRDIWQ